MPSNISLNSVRFNWIISALGRSLRCRKSYQRWKTNYNLLVVCFLWFIHKLINICLTGFLIYCFVNEGLKRWWLLSIWDEADKTLALNLKGTGAMYLSFVPDVDGDGVDDQAMCEELIGSLYSHNRCSALTVGFRGLRGRCLYLRFRVHVGG